MVEICASDSLTSLLCEACCVRGGADRPELSPSCKCWAVGQVGFFRCLLSNICILKKRRSDVIL